MDDEGVSSHVHHLKKPTSVIWAGAKETRWVLQWVAYPEQIRGGRAASQEALKPWGQAASIWTLILPSVCWVELAMFLDGPLLHGKQ